MAKVKVSQLTDKQKKWLLEEQVAKANLQRADTINQAREQYRSGIEDEIRSEIQSRYRVTSPDNIFDRMSDNQETKKNLEDNIEKNNNSRANFYTNRYIKNNQNEDKKTTTTGSRSPFASSKNEYLGNALQTGKYKNNNNGTVKVGTDENKEILPLQKHVLQQIGEPEKEEKKEEKEEPEKLSNTSQLAHLVKRQEIERMSRDPKLYNQYKDYIDEQLHNFKMEDAIREGQKEAKEIDEGMESGNYIPTIAKFLSNQFGRGVESAGVGLADAGDMLLGSTLYAMGDKKAGSEVFLEPAKRRDEIKQLSDYYSQDIQDKGLKFAGTNVSYQIGNMTPGILSSFVLPGSGIVSTATSAGGRKGIETLNEDNSNIENALLTGTITFGTEALTEMMFSGNALTRGLNATPLDELASNAVSKVGNPFLRRLAGLGMDVLGENAEELVSNVVERGTDALINGKEFGSPEELLNEGIQTILSTSATTAVTGLFGLGGETYNEANQIRALRDSYNNSVKLANLDVNNQSIKSLFNSANSKELTPMFSSEIFENSNDSYKVVEMSDGSKILAINPDANITEVNEQIRKMNNKQLEQITTPMDEDIAEGIRRTAENNYLKEQQQESNRVALQESARQYGINPENETIQQIQSTLSDRGIRSYFDETFFDSPNVGALYRLSRNEDGSYSREIVFNPNANENTIIQEMAVHELTHDIVASKTDVSQSMFDDVMNYLQQDTENFNAVRESVVNAYMQKYANSEVDVNSPDFQSMIDEELVAKTLQAKLGNQEFINKLHNENRTLFQKFVDWINDKVESFKNRNNAEYKFWKDIQNKFVEAYKNSEFNPDKASSELYSNDTNLPTTDNQGRTLSKGQQEYFKDSKVRDENGNLIEVYHGTPNGGFTIFDRNKISNTSTTHQWGYGFYFSNNSSVGDEYTRNYNNNTGEYSISKNPQKYTAYLDIKNPFIISDTISGAEGHSFDRNKLKELILKGNDEWFYDSWIPFSTKTPNELNYKLDGLTEEQIKNLTKEEKVDYWLRQEYDERGNKNILQEMERAYKNVQDLMDNFQKILGYDGIIVNGRNGTNQYIVFNPEQIKNVDNTNPTTNPDIRYSIDTNGATEDNQGRKLSKAQQEYFKNSKIRDNNGNLITVYHGTPVKERFTTFDRSKAGSNVQADFDGIYFTDSQSFGERFAHQQIPTGDSVLSTVRLGERGNLYEGYLNIQNPLNLNNLTEEQLQELYDYVKDEWKDIDPKESFISRWRIMNNGVNAQGIKFDLDLKKVQDAGYDGVIANLGEKNEVNGKYVNTGENEYIVFNSNQFKNIDNTNPTSNPDIRYSISDSQTDRLTDLNENFDLTVKTREELYDQRDSLQKEYKAITNSQEYKDAVKKLTKMTDLNNIENTPEYQLVLKAQNFKNKLSDIEEEIKIATSEIERISDAIDKEEKQHRNPEQAIKEAKDFLGTTNNFKEAGYMLQSGELLDFSGRSQGSNAYNQRTIDHREINQFGYDMDEFINLGNIRLQPESNGFELMQEPTAEQYSKLKEYINNANGEVFIDVYKNARMGTYDSANYKAGTPTSKIISDLQYYFKNGTFPTKSSLAEFRYSVNKPQGFDEYIANRVGKEGTRTSYKDLGLPGARQIQQVANQQENNYNELTQTEAPKQVLPTQETKQIPTTEPQINDTRKGIIDNYRKFRELGEKAKKGEVSDDEFFSSPYSQNAREGLKQLGLNAETIDRIMIELGSLNIDQVTDKNINDMIRLYEVPAGEEREKVRASIMRENAGLTESVENTEETEYNIPIEEELNNEQRTIPENNPGEEQRSLENLPTENEATDSRVKRITSRYQNGGRETTKATREAIKEQLLDSLPISKNKATNFAKEFLEKDIPIEDIKTFIERNSKLTTTTVNQEVQELRNRIWNTPIKLNDFVRRELQYEYGGLPKNLRYSENGLPVDTFYKELLETNPGWLDPEIANEGQEAIALVEFMQEVDAVDKKVTNFLTDTEIDELTQDLINAKIEYEQTMANVEYLDELDKSIGKQIKEAEKASFLSAKNKTQTTQPTQQAPILPPVNNNNIAETNEDGTGKQRRAYRSIIESDYMSDEAKAISNKLIGSDTYIPDSNKAQLQRADERIDRNGVTNELATLETNALEGKTIKADDIAVGDRLIQYYSKIGDVDNLERAIRATAMAGTQAGRAVQAFSMLRRQSPNGMAIWIQNSVDKLNSKINGNNKYNFTQEMQQKILNSTEENFETNVEEVLKELGDQVPKSLVGKLDEWRYFSMLANPKTHIRNIVGNLTMGQVQKVKNKVAGAIESATLGTETGRNVLSKIAGRDITEGRTHSWKPTTQENRAWAKEFLNDKDINSRLGIGSDKYTPKQGIEKYQRTFKSDALENTLGKMFDINSKLLEVEDNFGLKNAYVTAFADYMDANNLTKATATNKQIAQAQKHAIEEAQRATFHQANSIATAIQTIENKNLGTRLFLGGILPFKKTPMNVAKTGFDYSPAGLLKAITYDTVQLRKGNIDVNTWIDNISQGLTGTGIAVIGYALAEAGILKASGGDDDKEKFEEATGSQNYAIKIGNNTYSLDWLAPTGIPLFIGAEFNRIAQNKSEETGKSKDETLNRLATFFDATATALNPMSEMSMISGLTSALKSYSQGNGQALAEIPTNAVKSYVNQVVPTALGQIAKTMDKYERSTTTTQTNTFSKAIDSTKNQMMSKIPGLRQLLPVKTDVWGNPVETKGYVENAILPWNRQELQNDKVNQELTRLYDETGDDSVFPATSFNKTLTIDKEKYRMTNQEFQDYKTNYGKKAHSLLSQLIKSDDYKGMTAEQKQTAIEEVYKYAKVTSNSKYATSNDIEYDNSTMNTIKTIKDNGGSEVDYFKYKGITKGMSTETEKMSAIRNSDFSLGSKRAIYSSTIGADDSKYNVLKNTGINIDTYLDYKSQKFANDETGAKKDKVFEYVNNSPMSYEQRLLTLGMEYSLSDAEQRRIVDIVANMGLTRDEQLQIFSKMKGFKVNGNNVTW